MNSPTDLPKMDYPIRIEIDPETNTFTAEFTDLPGCTAYGETIEEVYRNAQAAKEEWIKTTQEQGLPVPAPVTRDEQSGRLLLRLPTSLHAMLAERSQLKGASLNQYIVHLLSAALVGDVVSSRLNEFKSFLTNHENRIFTAVGSAFLRNHYQQPEQKRGGASTVLTNDPYDRQSDLRYKVIQ